MRRARFVVCACAIAIGAIVSAQDAPVRIFFASPGERTLVTGPTAIRIGVTPEEQASAFTRVLVTVNGSTVCSMTTAPFECEWDAGRDVVSRTWRVVATRNDGTRVVQVMRTPGIGPVERSEVVAIQLTVVVTDGNGEFVRQLPKDAFQVFEDGKPQDVTTFESDNIPLELVAAVDVSQSMAEAMDDTKRAAGAFLSALRESDHVTLLAFNDNIFTLARRSTNHEARLRAVNRLAPWGGTALHDVIIRGVDALAKSRGRRALVIFSDGEDQSSRATMEAAVRRVEGSDVTLYTIGLGQAMRVAALRQLLDRLATMSGGRALFPTQSKDVSTAFETIASDLSNQYLIGYQPKNQNRDGTWREIEIKLRDVPGGYRVRARQGYRLLPN